MTTESPASQQLQPPPTADDLILAIIRRTGMPIAPIAIEKLNDALVCVNKTRIFSKETSKDVVSAVQGRMLKDFGSPELNELTGKPEFVVALCILLEVSLQYYAIETVKEFRAKA